MFLYVLMHYKYAVQKEVNPLGLLHARPLITDTCALWYQFIGAKLLVWLRLLDLPPLIWGITTCRLNMPCSCVGRPKIKWY